MDGIRFNETAFYQEQQEAGWKWVWPVNLAVAVHVIAAAMALYLPSFLERRPLLDEVVTVDLVSMPQPAKMAVPQEARQPEPVAKKAVQPSAVEPDISAVPLSTKAESSPQPAVMENPISIQPLKRKIKKAVDTRLAEEKQRQQVAEEKKRQLLEEKRQLLEEKKRQEEARKRAVARAEQLEIMADEEAMRARAELAAVLRETKTMQSSRKPGSEAPSSGRKQVQSLALQQYLSSLYDRVHSYWVLPEMRQWNKGLETIVVLTIRRDGTVARSTIEKKSSDPFFDQFVMKTIESASPMPSFSNLMTEPVLEVGMRFRPGELSSW